VKSRRLLARGGRKLIVESPSSEQRSLGWLVVGAAAVRVALGIIVAVDAWLKWQPGFAAHYVGYLQNGANGQPRFLASWFRWWLDLVTEGIGMGMNSFEARGARGSSVPCAFGGSARTSS
jgi:hypothetical protein